MSSGLLYISLSIMENISVIEPDGSMRNLFSRTKQCLIPFNYAQIDG